MNEDEIKQRLSRAIGAVGEIPAGYAYLGNSDRAIVSSFPNRTVYISGTNIAAEAKFSQSMSLLSINNVKYAGARVKLGYPNYDPLVLYVTAFDTGEGVSALNGLTPQEQHTQDAIYPDVGKIINGRLSPNNPPDLNIFVSPFAYYTTTGVWYSFGGDGLDTDFTADIAALSGTHQMAVVYLDTATGDLGRVLSTAVTGGSADKDTLDASTVGGLTFAAGYILLGVVHLYDGQTTVEETDIYRTADPRVIYPTPGAGASDTDAIHSSVAGEINVLTAKTTPVAGDMILIEDSAAGYIKKKVDIADLPGASSGGVITVGDYASSRPASPGTGDMYIVRDGFFNEIYDGSWKFTDRGRVFVKPSGLTWAWINQNSASESHSLGAVYLSDSVSAGGHNWAIRKKAAPSAPYTITAYIEPWAEAYSTVEMAICFRESGSGKLHFNYLYNASGAWGVYSGLFTNPTTQSTSYATGIALAYTPPKYLRIQDDNTNRICSYSYDGRNFIAYHTVARTTDLTADEVGFALNPFSISAKCSMTLYSWEES